jgi:TLC domain
VRVLTLQHRVDCSLMVTFQFRWPLQFVAFDTMIENVPHNNHYLSPLHSIQRLYACGMAAVLFFVACTITYHVASRFVSDWTAEKRVSFCSNAVGTLNSIVSTPLSLFALYDILSPMVPTIDCRTASAGEVNLAMVTSSLTIVITTGAVCGFFVFDMSLLAVSKTYRDVLGGSLTVLLLVHHIISLVVWPYCVLVDRSVFFVVQLLTTELSNIGQNIYNIYNALPIQHTLSLPIGITWIVLFAACRIVVMPWVAYVYYELLVLPGCGYTPLERIVGLITVPIPSMMNVWWFYLLIAGAIKQVGGGDVNQK